MSGKVVWIWSLMYMVMWFEVCPIKHTVRQKHRQTHEQMDTDMMHPSDSSLQRDSVKQWANGRFQNCEIHSLIAGFKDFQ